MSRKFIAAIVALSLTVAGVTASQAQAGDKRTRNLIVGAATLAIIGAAIANQNRDDRNTYVGTSNTGYRNQPQQGVKPRHQRHSAQVVRPRHKGHSHRRIEPRPLPPRAKFGQLPNRCLRSYPIRGGRIVQRYDARCVERYRNSANNRRYNRH